ncbi:unnamed protein product [Trichogramma brassicae]|uniref:Uncharacterized protein n=1 Tax=Trichogramma brassicae TaxID=86971 RepID=A0A6H5IFS5_9HYME|nr:unnamed protein product [Trichogramma brassicae]
MTPHLANCQNHQPRYRRDHGKNDKEVIITIEYAEPNISKNWNQKTSNARTARKKMFLLNSAGRTDISERKAVSRFNNETCCNNRWLNNSKAAHGTAPAIVTEKSCVSSSPATAEPSLISQSPMNSEKSSVKENEEGRLSIEHRAGTPMVDESQADPQQQLPMYSPGDERLTWSHHYYPSSSNSTEV